MAGSLMPFESSTSITPVHHPSEDRCRRRKQIRRQPVSFLPCPALRQYTSAIPILAAIALITPAATVHAADSIERTVTGKWRFTAALDGSYIVSLNEREAQQLIGHVFVISKAKVKIDKRDCGPTDFDAEKVEPRLYLREQAHASAAKLGLPNPVTVVNLGCTVAFVKARDRLVIHWGGWFFDARRQR